MPVRVVNNEGTLVVSATELSASEGLKTWYVRHPDHDLAVFEMPVPQDLPGGFLVPLMDEKSLDPNQRPRAGERVIFAGYPQGQFLSVAAFPILRDGIVASYEQEVFDSPIFLINGDVSPGDSGAPVARVTRFGKICITGIVIQRLDDGEHKSLPLAVAVDVSVIRETLRLFMDTIAKERVMRPQ